MTIGPTYYNVCVKIKLYRRAIGHGLTLLKEQTRFDVRKCWCWQRTVNELTKLSSENYIFIVYILAFCLAGLYV